MKKYLLIIFLCFSFLQSNAQSLKKKGFIFDTKTYNFGDVEQWHNQAAIFTFTNKTNHLVSILPLFKENDLEIIFPDKPIKIGESVVIKAKYYTDGKGSFNRRFSIYFGSLAEPVYLRITGNIKSLSPAAYIACPMSKPELAKPKIELIGDIAEIDTEIPLSGTVIEIVGLQNNKEITLYSSSRGGFGTKIPVGNYQIKVSHPNYYTYTGPFYVGQTSPPLRIRLTPINDNPVFAHNNTEVGKEEIPKAREKEVYQDISTKEETLKTKKTKEEEPTYKEHTTNSNSQEDKNPSKTNNYDRLDRDFGKKSTEKPTDSPFSKEDKDVNNETEVPKTLTTYKKSSEPKKDDYFSNDNTQNVPRNKNKNEPARDEPEKIFSEEKSSKPKKGTSEKENNPREAKEKKIKEAKEKINKEPKERIEKIVIPTSLYTFRVLDSKTLEPIPGATIYIHDIYDKKNKHKGNTDERGYSELNITKNDYRFLASADGYISNEIRILKDDRSEIFKILLSPVSDLFNEIYEAKKAKQKDDEEILEKFSFGKSDFSFAKGDVETKKEDDEPKLIVYKNENERIEKELEEEKLKLAKEKQEALDLKTANLERRKKEQALELARIEKLKKEQLAKEKEDSLKLVIEQLALENSAKERAIENADKLKESEKQKERAKIDSLNLYIKNLLAKNENLEKDLDKTKNEKDDLASRNAKNKETINDLNAKNKELEEPISDFGLSKTKYVANNILFLIDVSTSMEKKQKIEMLKKSIKNLVGVLRDIDRVAIITYNQKSNVVLESVSGNNTAKITAAIDSLKTGGLTNGVRGITAAYEMLEYYFIPGGNNQIILATDGLFSKYNNEMTQFELNRLVKKYAEKEMKLTVVGFGKNEEGKDLMTKLANNGTGQYIQIKNDYMTNDVLIKEIKLNSEKK